MVQVVRIERNQSLCTYNGGFSCSNKRALGRNGRKLLRLCEYHRRCANVYQKKYLESNKKQQTSPPQDHAVSSPVSVAAAPSPMTAVFFTDDAASLHRHQPFVTVSSDSNERVSDLWRRVSGGGSDATNSAVGPHNALTARMMATPAAYEQFETTRAMDFEPFAFQPQSWNDAATPVFRAGTDLVQPILFPLELSTDLVTSDSDEDTDWIFFRE